MSVKLDPTNPPRPGSLVHESGLDMVKRRDNMVERRDDMGNGKLRLVLDGDGDVSVALVLPGHGFLSVEFCVPGTGGGLSPRTHRALRELFKAMAADDEAERSAVERRSVLLGTETPLAGPKTSTDRTTDG